MKRFASVESKVAQQMGREQPRQPYQPEQQQHRSTLTKAQQMKIRMQREREAAQSVEQPPSRQMQQNHGSTPMLMEQPIQMERSPVRQGPNKENLSALIARSRQGLPQAEAETPVVMEKPMAMEKPPMPKRAAPAAPQDESIFALANKKVSPSQDLPAIVKQKPGS